MINNRNKNITSQVKNDRISRRKGAIPILLSAITNNAGDKVTMSFNTKMKSPVGKEGEFSLKDIVAIDNTYQKWEGYPDTPSGYPTSTYPYQIIFDDGVGNDILCYSQHKFYWDSATLKLYPSNSTYYYKRFYKNHVSNTWINENVELHGNDLTLNNYTFKETNYNVYTDSTLTTVFFAKTTPDSIDTPINLSGLALDTDTKKIVASVFTTEGLYQKWEGYPDSPTDAPLTTFPNHLIITSQDGINTYLVCTKTPIASNPFYSVGNGLGYWNQKRLYQLNKINNTWSFINSSNTQNYTEDPGLKTINESNVNVYTASTSTDINFAKSTKSISPAITNGQTIKLDYTQGTVASSEGDKLKSFSGVEVENASGLYQEWVNYQSSPLLTSLYPYQAITSTDTKAYLLLSTIKIYTVPDVSYPCGFISGNGKLYSIDLPITNPTWNFTLTVTAGSKVRLADQLKQANNSVYTDEFYGTIYFDKTTT